MYSTLDTVTSFTQHQVEYIQTWSLVLHSIRQSTYIQGHYFPQHQVEYIYRHGHQFYTTLGRVHIDMVTSFTQHQVEYIQTWSLVLHNIRQSTYIQGHQFYTTLGRVHIDMVTSLTQHQVEYIQTWSLVLHNIRQSIYRPNVVLNW